MVRPACVFAVLTCLNSSSALLVPRTPGNSPALNNVGIDHGAVQFARRVLKSQATAWREDTQRATFGVREGQKRGQTAGTKQRDIAISDRMVNFRAVWQSFFTVGVAEIFDRTWFVAFAMALRANRTVVFWSSSIGLLLHVAIAAGLGFSLSKLLPLSTLNFISSAVFGIFTSFYAWEWYVCEKGSDLMASGKEDAEECITLKRDSSWWSVFTSMLWLIFLAEWGDRTQIAMIGLHSSKPLIPVCIGSALALLILTASAVAAASLVGHTTLSERTVKAISAGSFLVLALIALKDGWAERQAELSNASIIGALEV